MGMGAQVLRRARARRHTTQARDSSAAVRFQVADVHKALLSITRAADAGFECHLGARGGCLLDTYTGERVPIARKGNLYVMKAWVKEDQTGAKPAQGFGRQG